MRCPNCGDAGDAGEQFCRRCGRQLVRVPSPATIRTGTATTPGRRIGRTTVAGIVVVAATVIGTVLIINGRTSTDVARDAAVEEPAPLAPAQSNPSTTAAVSGPVLDVPSTPSVKEDRQAKPFDGGPLTPELAWRNQITGPLNPTAAGDVLGQTVVSDTLVMTVVGDDVRAFDKVTGEPRWTSKGDVFPTALVLTTSDLMLWRAKVLEAIDVRTGVVRWTYAVQKTVGSPVAIAGNVVYVGDGGATAIDLPTGKPVWHRDEPVFSASSVEPAVAVGPHDVFLARRHIVMAIDAKTGEDKWAFTVRQGELIEVERLLAVDASLIVVAKQTVAALNGQDGALLWSTTFAPGGSAPDFIGVACSMILVSQSGSALSALRVADGSVAWQLTGQRELGGAAMDGSTILAASGGLVVISAVTGLPVAGRVIGISGPPQGDGQRLYVMARSDPDTGKPITSPTYAAAFREYALEAYDYQPEPCVEVAGPSSSVPAP
jgi:outer membrane protein assembly factor BamB